MYHNSLLNFNRLCSHFQYKYTNYCLNCKKPRVFYSIQSHRSKIFSTTCNCVHVILSAMSITSARSEATQNVAKLKPNTSFMKSVAVQC